MQKKVMSWKTKGMNRDLSVSAFNPEFAYENRNLRLSTNDDNTMLSWVNEKSTKGLILSIAKASNTWIDNQSWPYGYDEDSQSYITGTYIIGIPIGTAVIDHKLVVFSTDPNGTSTQKDFIYVFKYSDGGSYDMDGYILYMGNLNFSSQNPLETLVWYEAEHIQKVYWVDGINQPRLINIAVLDYDQDKLVRWNTSGNNTFFDFIPTLKFGETVNITKSLSGGIFAPGVIQYCFTYVNKYGQQSNIAYVSPLYYLTYKDRAASPEEKVSCSFNIKVLGVDTNYDYLRLYSIQRTSLDTDPFVKLLEDIPIESSNVENNQVFVTYVDNGTTGSTVDPYELLYVGGKEIIASTMADKDNTLFLGNIEEKNEDISAIQEWFDNHKQTPEFALSADKFIEDKTSDDLHLYFSEIADNDSLQVTTFKGGENYRLGFQLQKFTGEWSEPIYLDDVDNDKYPIRASITRDSQNILGFELPYASLTFNLNNLIGAFPDLFTIYKRIRPLVVYPTIADRKVVCQGVLNPTVFNAEDRKEGMPYAQASWYFRPYIWGDNQDRSHIEFQHYFPLLSAQHQEGQIDGAVDNRKVVYEAYRGTEIENSFAFPSHVQDKDEELSLKDTNTQFFVDHSIVTLNSPDVEFDTEVQLVSTQDLKLRIIGIVPISTGISSHSISIASNMLPERYNFSDVIPTGYGTGELDNNVINRLSDRDSLGRIHLAAEFLWNDSDVAVQDSKVVTFEERFDDFLVFPWQSTGALNTDWRGTSEAASVLKIKKEANLMYSPYSRYLDNYNKVISGSIDFMDISSAIQLTENNWVRNIRLEGQTSEMNTINYYPNIDKVLIDRTGNSDLVGNYAYYKDSGGHIKPFSNTGSEQIDARYEALQKKKNPVAMKYKSTSHVAIALKGDYINEWNQISILPYAKVGSDSTGYIGGREITGDATYNTFWGEKIESLQGCVESESLFADEYINDAHTSFLWLGELYKDVTNPFGGKSKAALRANKWLVGGAAVEFSENSSTVNLKWTEGDTYYQRYDCMKTYPFTNEDTNQLVEILSFMCETHVNIDGRYDRNRGQSKNYLMSPEIFNMMNTVYSQKDNYFINRIVRDDRMTSYKYPNQITYTKTKQSGADVDLYTNITLASMLELDGDKGKLNALKRFNNQILAFQDTGISQVLYNENVQIESVQGVPIEIANSGKVQGKRYLSDTIGCSNKWSMATSPSGIYFMDSIGKNIFLFNGQLSNLSLEKGMDAWSKQHIHSQRIHWTPWEFDTFTSFYDKKNQEILFVDGKEALAYSEKFGQFTSFYDYGKAPFFCNLDDTGVWVNTVVTEDGEDERYVTSLWQHQTGDDYCKFFNFKYPYSMTLVGNPEPTLSKIFTNLEFRACTTPDGSDGSSKYNFNLPFDSIHVENEYQEASSILQQKSGRELTKHFGTTSALNRKYRIWRCDIPRDGRNWMRNPWIYLQLTKKEQENMPKVEIHDMQMIYYT